MYKALPSLPDLVIEAVSLVGSYAKSYHHFTAWKFPSLFFLFSLLFACCFYGHLSITGALFSGTLHHKTFLENHLSDHWEKQLRVEGMKVQEIQCHEFSVKSQTGTGFSKQLRYYCKLSFRW